MGYVASPLWLLFLLLSSINVVRAVAGGGFTPLPQDYTSVFGYIVEVPEALGSLERYVVINAIDHHWQEHLTEMEELRRSIGLRSYGQKDPLVEYKGEAYRFFEELMNNVRLQICTGLFRSASNLASFENMLSLLSRTARAVGPTDAPAPAPAAATAAPEAQPAEEVQLPKVTVRREVPKVGRNDPCPCGSGKKFKHCHGA